MEEPLTINLLHPKVILQNKKLFALLYLGFIPVLTNRNKNYFSIDDRGYFYYANYNQLFKKGNVKLSIDDAQSYVSKFVKNQNSKYNNHFLLKTNNITRIYPDLQINHAEFSVNYFTNGKKPCYIYLKYFPIINGKTGYNDFFYSFKISNRGIIELRINFRPIIFSNAFNTII